MIRSANLEMETTRQKITELWIELTAAGNEAALTGYRNQIKLDINQQEEILAGYKNLANRCECHGYILVSN